MKKEIRDMFLEDIELMEEFMEDSENYNFADELKACMQKNALSSSALGERALVSHTIVDKWLAGKAKPNGKERMKELGMALGYNVEELNMFLYKNGYPKLYAKNPLDSAAKLLLSNKAGDPQIVELYRDLVKRLGLETIILPEEKINCDTKVMSAELKDAAAQGQISGWFRNHDKNFTGDAKTQLPDMRIIRFIMLYVGDSTINEMAVTGDLPLTLKKLLYELVGGKNVNTRGLREKLIAFGLYSNMTEEEIDIMLEYARLRAISEPVSRLDFVLLFALRTAHDHYPYYEFENLSRIVKKFKQSSEDYDKILLPDYCERLENARQRTEYYDRCNDEKEKSIFEENYTSYSDKGVMDYIRDILMVLRENKTLKEEEIKPIWDLIQRGENGKSIWNTQGG